MKIMRLATAVVFAALSMSVHAAKAAGTEGCEGLNSLRLKDTTISARPVAAGDAASIPEVAAMVKQMAQLMRTPPNVPDTPSFCRVTGVIKPTLTSNIKFELWLPLDGWNQRYWGVGNGGLAGYFAYPDLLKAVARGYAVSTTNTGHDNGMQSAVAFRDKERLRDFTDRAIHLTAVISKQVVATYYSKPSFYSYFSGCSNGGRQALVEAQRYPDDYDGILAGAPATIFPAMARNAAIAQMLTKDPGAELGPAQLTLLHRAAIEDCDNLDGLKDDLISAPLSCRVNVDRLLCKGPAGSDCLTASQVAMAKWNYGSVGGKTDLRDAQMPGSELLWRFARMGAGLSETWYTNVVYPKREKPWTAADYDGSKDIAALEESAKMMSGENPDLSAFAARNGKLIVWMGMADQAVPYEQKIDYAEAVRERMGGKADEVMSTFLVPGLAHCSGGEGFSFSNDGAGRDPNLPANQDLAAALQAWVEKGTKPELIVAQRGDLTQKPPVFVATRPICTYPRVARLTPGADPAQAASFTCPRSN